MKLNLNEIVELHYELNGMTYTKDGVSTVVSNGLLKQNTTMRHRYLTIWLTYCTWHCLYCRCLSWQLFCLQ